MSDITYNGLKMMENAFSDYLVNKITDKTLCSKLSSVLSSLRFHNEAKQFEISIVNSNMKESFFGVRVFPIIDTLNDIVGDMVVEKRSFKDLCKKWKSINKWYIEIDAQVLNKMMISFTPQELVSLILHEIGHVLYSEKPLEIFYRAYQEAYMRLKVADKASLKVLYTLYTIPLASACMLRSWKHGKTNVKEEYFADSTLHKMGYGDHLYSAIGKIISQYGNTAQTSQSQGLNAIQTSIKWCNVNIVDLTKRQKRLKDDLFYHTIKNESGYIKALSYKILTTLGLKLRESYTGSVIESSIELICSEGFITDYDSIFDLATITKLEKRLNYARESSEREISLEALGKPKPPSRYDIDAISVEVDRITNHHDRIYVLDLIYHKISELERFKEVMAKNKNLQRKHSDKVGPMLNDLEEMRNLVLSKRTFGSNYKLFVKVPDGYEG